ncbi:hypothetical protein IVA79_22410 [Bradyrhizobium sp. 138]|uniref:hypothetical protein n=1 Tax=Bradyrhizobium sp. 138 TaxID=2782615 RepID=UPI001FFB679F|nr:hypothetical protein [Bradyrhizobium sp. 138]MCK1736631.1 hypothetical protein [Bradyrhizobium sp. 138]
MSQEDAKWFRDQAEECIQNAASLSTQAAKEAWLRLAGNLIRLAEGVELRGTRARKDSD